MKHPLIIGAGGVASYLLPVLLKTFRPTALTIIDKDRLEERNLDRQMFKPEQVGQLKAAALTALHIPKDTLPVRIIPEWFEENMELPEGIDAIFCCADNHHTRYSAILAANRIGCHAYIGGNEYVDSQALVYHPSWRGTDRDLLLKYPNIMTDETGSPFRCTGEAQEAAPQLAMANMGCAAKLLQLAWVYERWFPEQNLPPSKREELLPHLPVEMMTTLTDNTADHVF